MSAPRTRAGYWLLSAAVLLADQVTKAAVARSLPLHESRLLVDGFFSLTSVRTRGGAFGAFSESDLPFQAALFSAVSLLALLAIVVYAWRTPAEHRSAHVALALVIAGALGNLVDRARLGDVVDVLDVYWGSHHWPAFNVADSAICVGFAILLVTSFAEDDEDGRA